MAKINANYLKLPGGYLFSEIARRVEDYAAQNPAARLLRLGIGDVTRPLAPAVVEAMSRAVEEMGRADTFRGYGPEQGYDFLRKAIVRDYQSRGVALAPEEIFVSDGAKSDCGSIGDIFAVDNTVAVCDPVYPAYVDASAMAGRAGDFDPRTGRWSRLIYLPCTEENRFLPRLPEKRADLIYLCFPNNPTGAAATREELKAWVDYARTQGAVLLFDAAYEAFITQAEVPHSIFEVEGAKECAVEFRSFSKTAGFTGTRCAFAVVPGELRVGGVSLNSLWSRRQATRFNGVPYVVQRGAEAVYSAEGRRQVQETLRFYQHNADVIRRGLAEAGLTVSGGVNAPYIWAETPEGMGSWDFFDLLLKRAGVVVTPGAGFGPGGEGYVRLSAFGGAEDTAEAVERIRAVL